MQSRPTNKYWLADLPIQKKMTLGVGLLLGLFLLTSLLTLSALRKQDENRQWSARTYTVLFDLNDIRGSLQTAQIGVRGYLLTGRPGQRALYDSAMRELATGIVQLRKATGDDALQQSRIDTIESLVSQWHEDINNQALQPLEQLRDPQSVAEALQRQHIQATYLQNRKVRAEDLLLDVDQMVAAQNTLLSTRNQKLDRNLRDTKIINAVAMLLGLLLGLTVIRWTARLVTRPLRRLTQFMTRLANHDPDFDIRQLDRRDEIGEIGRGLQVFRQMAIEIQAQSWLKTQVSNISHRLQQAGTHREFGGWLTNELVPLFRGGVGLFYSWDEERMRLDLLGSYGLRLGGPNAGQYVPGEGLVGQCAADRKAIFLDQVPAGYVHIDSGSGDASPRHLAILPVMFRDALIGVLEMGGFAALTTLQKQLLDELLPIVALTLENLNRSIHTTELLTQTREQADELRLSELVMRQQKDVLRENNDALQAKTAELEEQSERLIASEEELRVQAEELQASNKELQEKTDSLNQQKLTLERLQHETSDKADQLERASQYKSEFLANMSHELRTPLNSLLILSRSLADNDTGNLDEEQIESARIINDAGTSLLHLINDILDLSKIEAGRMELVIDELPLADLERRIARSFRHVAESKGVDFRIEVDPGLPLLLRTDGIKLEQIINNLLSNAFKFTAEGSVTLRMGRPGIDVVVPEALRDQPLIALSVTDSGIGIPADKFERVFNAFEQVDASTSRQFGGTGLGLAISRRMAELMGGDICLRSRSGEGSCFTLLLPETPPAAISEAPAAATAMPMAVRVPSSQLLPDAIADDRHLIQPGQTTILVIEDDAAFSRILVDMIHRKGYRALAANDGADGLRLAREYHPTGILLDVMLPTMDGWTVLGELKADPATRIIPVHFISATDEASRGLDHGAVGFLTKPVSREAIGAAFEKLLHFAEGEPRRLLIVDDDADARTAVRAMLRAQNVQMDEAGSAEQALEQARQVRYDCIVLDLTLPGMSGLELLEHLSQLPDGVPPVVIYSGRDLSRDENLLLRQYTDSIVLKGARSPERLLDEVSLFLHSIKHAPTAATAAPDNAGEPDLSGRRLLLVDDDMRNLFALSKVLRGWGLQVTMAQDGLKALKALADDPALELVLMDIMMPGMDGYQAISEIRAQPHMSQLPIIALTAKAMRGDREKCLALGASDYLSKPIDIDKLGSMLRVWLRR